MVNPKKYVVLDVETNGLSSKENDLLSISIYKPDDGKMYNRFLPLELNTEVWTTIYNGITDDMLEDKLPLTQEEFDNLVIDYELDKRIILIYGNLDKPFIMNYLLRKKIKGGKKLNFYNFKHDVISSIFSKGMITKDNLCNLYKIEGVSEIHSGANDCILEWKLFKKMNNNKLLVINNDVFQFSSDYIVPVSYLTYYPNFKYVINKYPEVDYKFESLKKFEIYSSKIKKFSNNISGVSLEHLINSMLNVNSLDKETIKETILNKKRLKKIGELPSPYHQIPITLNDDGTLNALKIEDFGFINEVNEVTNDFRKKIEPLISYIKEYIFNDNDISSHELVINQKYNVLAICDLSSKDSVMEIKTFEINQRILDRIKYQLYFQSNGRDIYILSLNWNKMRSGYVVFEISKIVSYIKDEDEPIKKRNILIKTEKEKEIFNFIKNDLKYQEYIKKITKKSNGKLYPLNHQKDNEVVKIMCLECGNVWEINKSILNKKCYCPKCNNIE